MMDARTIKIVVALMRDEVLLLTLSRGIAGHV
jgi:hypothetical protein